MSRTKKKSVCPRNPMPVLNDDNNSDSDTDWPETDEVLSHKTIEIKKRHENQVMSADTEDILIDLRSHYEMTVRRPCDQVPSGKLGDLGGGSATWDNGTYRL